MAPILSPYYNPLQFNSDDLFSIKSTESSSPSNSTMSSSWWVKLLSCSRVQVLSFRKKK
ncbi:hypothetical protein LguiB_003605 [Lonicera macranthoides]